MQNEPPTLPPRCTRQYLKRLAIVGIRKRYGATPIARKYNALLTRFARQNIEHMRLLTTGIGPTRAVLDFFKMCADYGVSMHSAFKAFDDMRQRVHAEDLKALAVTKASEPQLEDERASMRFYSPMMKWEIVGGSVMFSRAPRPDARDPPAP